ncbi:MAG: response regulator transcription factor [Marinisporobacter sp.]|jgi:DNA-binding response OmpR family regulator|nr:response regulator transcription factor [Marinisporobacter sp.]
MKILIVDDEELLVKGLKKSLTIEGFHVEVAYDGKSAIDIIKTSKIDFVLLDIMLPEIDGMTLCKTIRQSLDIPIIMLTAKDDYVDKVLGLELGADDYVTKPFHTRELISRIRAVYRRTKKSKQDENIIQVGYLKINGTERTLFKENKEVIVTSKEFDILYLLITNSGMVFSRDKLFEKIWNEPGYDTRTIDVHIKNIREKIEKDPRKPTYLKTKWGVGYFFRKEVL